MSGKQRVQTGALAATSLHPSASIDRAALPASKQLDSLTPFGRSVHRPLSLRHRRPSKRNNMHTCRHCQSRVVDARTRSTFVQSYNVDLSRSPRPLCPVISLLYAVRVHSGKRKTTLWCLLTLFVCLSVCLSRNVFFLNAVRGHRTFRTSV